MQITDFQRKTLCYKLEYVYIGGARKTLLILIKIISILIGNKILVANKRICLLLMIISTIRFKIINELLNLFFFILQDTRIG